MAEAWVLNPSVVMHWRLIDGEWLVYEALSGATHMIDHLSAAVLTCFESRATLSMHELLALLATDLALEVTAAQAGTVLQQWCALDMLLPATRPAPMHAAA
ncbi:MAG: HPr-rel-A system PqqD family peptide chaperone [Pseudomonadota bacterium]|jgi:PqqD family protein of HPr-rel-A system